MKILLGTHQVNWLWAGQCRGPLFVAEPRLRFKGRLARPALDPYYIDSGAFSVIAAHGGWTYGPEEYAARLAHWDRQLGPYVWAAPQDWMCEPVMIDRTRLSVVEHQRRTVRSYLDLRERARVIPVVQGYRIEEYGRCIEMYGEAGVDLTKGTVGVGSVCRRQDSREIEDVIRSIAERGIRIHAFGVKAGGLERYADALFSCDSLSWSYEARRNKPLDGCRHPRCSNCPIYAARWRDRLYSKIGGGHEE